MKCRHALRLALFLLIGGCATVDPPAVGEEPLSDLDALMEGAPADRGMSLPADGKADEAIPSSFDLMEYMTPIRDQGYRGTCTIFATAALMESLYKREGTLADPDFSEQFLQWSVKSEVRAFTDTAGSSPSYNLQAIHRFGIVEENLWPYESRQWGPSDDPACTGDAQPTRCYTNGDPPPEALSATRWTLPPGRWINPSRRSLQGHMLSTRTPVLVSGDFFYQAWNHGHSNLPTSLELKRQGYVLSPNPEDVEDSSGDRRAGHGYILIGWDDEREVQRRDAEGRPAVDEEGNPVMERGFFLFKNSWGSRGTFGAENPYGPGYGWISYAYVEQYLTAYVADVPEVMLTEVCNDDRDNDRDGLADCDDPDCAGERACVDPVGSLSNTTSVEIPDNDPTGASSSIEVVEPGTISSLSVTVDITHTYRGDLSVYLVRGDTRAVLFDRQGGSADDLVETFTVSDFNGTDAAGVYELVVVDHSRQDTGTLNQWSLDITRCDTDCGGTATTHSYDGEGGVAIPDGASVSRSIHITDPGTIETMSVRVDIAHTFPYELTIRFGREGGREFVLLTEDTSSESGVARTFDVPGFVGEEIAGDWTLTVVDGAMGDTGTLTSWGIQASVR